MSGARIEAAKNPACPDCGRTSGVCDKCRGDIARCVAAVAGRLRAVQLDDGPTVLLRALRRLSGET